MECRAKDTKRASHAPGQAHTDQAHERERCDACVHTLRFKGAAPSLVPETKP